MAATTLTNGHANGHANGHHYPNSFARFSDVPPVIDIPVGGSASDDEVVNLDLSDLLDETDELCDLLENENAAKNYWVTIALAYAKQNKIDIAIGILQKGLSALKGRGAGASAEDRLGVLAAICWLWLLKCRRAPRVRPQPGAGGAVGGGEEEKTKDQCLHAATSTLNEASRINPSYPPLFLARGTLYLLRASLQPSKSSTGAGGATDERTETLKQAAKCFDDAYKQSGGKNLMAMLGKAKVQFSLSRYSESLALYQQILSSAPDLTDPDPRIGIGCCLWALSHKDAAREAWQRSLDLNSEKNVPANVLLGLSYLDSSSHLATSSKEFAELYKKAMTLHTQAAFKTDAMHALTCATFGSYFLLRKAWPNVERLARRAIERTDVNAVASDGWYLLARAEHSKGAEGKGDLGKAAEYYGKADLARGGEERGFLPAKFGAAQLKTLMGDLDGARFRLDKILSLASSSTSMAVGAGGVAGKERSLEAMTLLGVLFAEEVFGNQAAGSKEDKSAELRKAISLLESVRMAWKDPKRKAMPDSAVLLNLARLYEQDSPEKALLCLQQVETMELSEIAEDDDRLPDEIGDEAEERRVRRELLSPQLLNNIGCFHYSAEKYTAAREDFQTALNACVKMAAREGEEVDTDALVTSVSFNLARTYEAEGLREEARGVYSGLLERHPEYTDARARLAYLSLTSPEGSEDDTTTAAATLKDLLTAEPGNLELRALYAWHLSKTKRRTANLPEDPEQKLYKETLQKWDKHDRYSLVGMGNLHLSVAREMRRDTDQEKEKRAKTYVRAVEFFDKVLSIDPRDAYASMGMGIAVVEDRRDVMGGVQVFSRVRESLASRGGGAGAGAGAGVYVNLGHVFAELKQWSKSIENYELAVARSAKERRDGKPDAQILACLGRVWLMRGRAEKKLEAYKTSLDLSKQALELAGEGSVAMKFNVAFVQIQLAQLLISLPEAGKTALDVQQAGEGLDEAIEVFASIAKGPAPPFPRGDLEARANMGRNTMKRQLGGALERQVEYERKNASRLEEARRRREEEIRKRAELAERVEAERAEKEAKVKEAREMMQEELRVQREQREKELREREDAELTTDAETGERRKREKRPRQKRKKKGAEDDGDTDGLATDGEGGGARSKARGSRATSGTPAAGTGSEMEGAGRKRKKRKLERKGQAVKSSSKYKSNEMVEDSDDGDDRVGRAGTQEGTPGAGVATPAAEDEDTDAVARPSRKKAARVVDEEEEDDEVAANGDGEGGAPMEGVDEGEQE